MGALSLNAVDKRIREALDDKVKMVNLQRMVARGPATQVVPLLRDLASVTTTLKTRHDVLLLAALDHDFGARRVGKDESKPTKELLDVYSQFVMNLVSVSAQFVEPALNSFARRGLLSEEESVRKATVTLLVQLLKMYPQATEVVAAVLRDRYPHPVRPYPELCLYTRSLFSIFEHCTSPVLQEAIIHAVIDKLVAVQPSVPDDVYYVEGELKEEESKTRVVSFDLPEEKKLCSHAEKMDALLIEVFQFLDRAKAHLGDAFAETVVEPLVTAFARFVAPAYGGRFVSFVLLYALSLSDGNIAEQVVNRLSIVFFDSSVISDIRIFYLSLSAALLIRTHCINAKFVMDWLKRVCQWLNQFIARNPEFPDNPDFVFAATCVARVVTERWDALNRNDGLARLRIMRILSVARLPNELRDKFCAIAANFGGVDIRSVAKPHRSGSYLPRSAKLLLENIELPRTKELMRDHYRQVVMDIAEPVEEFRNQIQSSVAAPIPMVLSSS